MENIESQNKKIRTHLLSGKTLTPLDALYRFECFRLSARIYNLRREGLRIGATTRTVTSPSVYSGKKHFTEYKLLK